MGICPDCGGWIDEGDCSCSCGSTRYMDDDREDDDSYYSGGSSTSWGWQYVPSQTFNEPVNENTKENEILRGRSEWEIDQILKKQREEKEKQRKEKEKQFEEKRKRAQMEFEIRQYEARKRWEKEQNEKNPDYLATQIGKVKRKVIANKILLISGPDHLTGIQKKVDNGFGEVIRLQNKLSQFDIDESNDYEALDEEIRTLKKENKSISYIIDHIDEAYSANAKEVLHRNTQRLNCLEEKFDSLYPKRGLFKKRDRTKRTRITLE